MATMCITQVGYHPTAHTLNIPGVYTKTYNSLHTPTSMIMLTTLPIKGSSGRVHVLITSTASPQEDTGSNPMLMNSTQRILYWGRAEAA